MIRVLIFFKNLLLIYISNWLLYINNKNLLITIHYEIYKTNLVSNLIIKRRLTEMLIYNKISKLKVANINNYNDDHEENKNSVTQRTEILKTLYRKEKNNKSKKKKIKLVLEAFDNIFIDKVTNTNIHEKYSKLEEEVFENAIIHSSSSILFAIPIFSYLSKRINFFDSPQ
ncbi:Plasmodium exported protein, unknown function [Plasmodium sp. DRC-Itaito]|nr:Plasmodium exported protein, unknown function [Plasmodium sp. DRC-Itaito]